MPLPPGDNRVPPPPKRTDSSQQAAGHEREMRRQQRPVANSTGAPGSGANADRFGGMPFTFELDGSGAGGQSPVPAQPGKTSGAGVIYVGCQGCTGADTAFLYFTTTSGSSYGPYGFPLLPSTNSGSLALTWLGFGGDLASISVVAPDATDGTVSGTYFYPNR